MRAIQNKSLEKFFGQNKDPEYCCTMLAEAPQLRELELWTIFTSIKEFTEICLAYPASTVETKLEIKWKTVQIIMFCLLYHYSTYMIQSMQRTGLSGMAWQNYWEQKKFTISQPVMGKADISTRKACYRIRPIPGHSSRFHQAPLPCFRGGQHALHTLCPWGWELWQYIEVVFQDSDNKYRISHNSLGDSTNGDCQLGWNFSYGLVLDPDSAGLL